MNELQELLTTGKRVTNTDLKAIKEKYVWSNAGYKIFVNETEDPKLPWFVKLEKGNIYGW